VLNLIKTNVLSDLAFFKGVELLPPHSACRFCSFLEGFLEAAFLEAAFLEAAAGAGATARIT
jgi:hypothetical protein